MTAATKICTETAAARNGRTRRSELHYRQLTSARVAFRSDDCSTRLVRSRWAGSTSQVPVCCCSRLAAWLQLPRLYRKYRTVRNQSNSDDKLSFNYRPISLHTALGQLIRAGWPGPIRAQRREQQTRVFRAPILRMPAGTRSAILYRLAHDFATLPENSALSER